jgi:hypothetical protein
MKRRPPPLSGEREGLDSVVCDGRSLDDNLRRLLEWFVGRAETIGRKIASVIIRRSGLIHLFIHFRTVGLSDARRRDRRAVSRAWAAGRSRQDALRRVPKTP